MEMHARPPAYRNNGLFSDHYLDVTLPRKPGSDAFTREAETVMEAVSALLDSYAPSANEAQTERDLVRSVLKLRGHDFEVQPALKTPDGTKRTDYVFYRDNARCRPPHQRPPEVSAQVVVVADGDYHERGAAYLDRDEGGGHHASRHPEHFAVWNGAAGPPKAPIRSAT